MKTDIDNLLLRLSTPEERATIIKARAKKALDEVSAIKDALQEAIATRDAEYAEALELLITETDKQVKSYLSSVVKDTNAKVDEINALVSKLESKTGIAETDIRNQIKDAKSELRDFSNRILTIHDTSRTETVSAIQDAVAQSKKTFKEIESKTEGIYKDIEGVKKDLMDKFSSSLGRGGAPHRRLQINGTTIATRYADVNYVVTGWAATNNNTTKQTDITITGSGGVGAWSTPPETPAVNGTTTVFTVGASAPTDVVADGMMYFDGKGYTYSGSQITFDIGGLGPVNYVRYR